MRLLEWLTQLFCSHRFILKLKGGRIYLECRKCLKTTPGFDFNNTFTGDTKACH